MRQETVLIGLLVFVALGVSLITNIVLIVRNHRLEADMEMVSVAWRELRAARTASDRAPMAHALDDDGVITLPAGPAGDSGTLRISPGSLAAASIRPVSRVVPITGGNPGHTGVGGAVRFIGEERHGDTRLRPGGPRVVCFPEGECYSGPLLYLDTALPPE